MDLINVIGVKKKQNKSYSKLEKDVRKVYPYAKRVSELLVKYDPIIDSLQLHSVFNRYQKKKAVF